MAGAAQYTVMIPRVPHAPGLAHSALQTVMNGKVPIHRAYLDPDKWAHWPGGQPEPHDLVVAYADDTPEMDSHVKQLARQVGQQGMLPAVFALKHGPKGVTTWTVDNPDLRQ